MISNVQGRINSCKMSVCLSLSRRTQLQANHITFYWKGKYLKKQQSKMFSFLHRLPLSPWMGSRSVPWPIPADIRYTLNKSDKQPHTLTAASIIRFSFSNHKKFICKVTEKKKHSAERNIYKVTFTEMAEIYLLKDSVWFWSWIWSQPFPGLILT